MCCRSRENYWNLNASAHISNSFFQTFITSRTLLSLFKTRIHLCPYVSNYCTLVNAGRLYILYFVYSILYSRKSKSITYQLCHTSLSHRLYWLWAMHIAAKNVQSSFLTRISYPGGLKRFTFVNENPFSKNHLYLSECLEWNLHTRTNASPGLLLSRAHYLQYFSFLFPTRKASKDPIGILVLFVLCSLLLLILSEPHNLQFHSSLRKTTTLLSDFCSSSFSFTNTSPP